MADAGRTKDALIGALMEAGRGLSTATVLFHQAVATRVGLNATDHKTMDLLIRSGPMTAGELAEATGLTAGAVTSLIDRLEERGFIERLSDPDDRRKVIVHPKPEVVQRRLGPLFASFIKEKRALCKRYSEAELEVLLDYEKRMTELLSKAATVVQHGPGEATE